MEFLAVVEQGALAYPALLPLVLVALALTLWACEHKRWLWATATGILGCAACLVYIGSPANASARTGNAPLQVGVAQVEPDKALTRGSRSATRALLDPGHFSSSVKLHPRFPRDFPIPRSFRALASLWTSRWRPAYVISRSSPSSPRQWMATLSPRPASTCRSRQLYDAFSFPSANHL